MFNETLKAVTCGYDPISIILIRHQAEAEINPRSNQAIICQVWSVTKCNTDVTFRFNIFVFCVRTVVLFLQKSTIDPLMQRSRPSTARESLKKTHLFLSHPPYLRTVKVYHLFCFFPWKINEILEKNKPLWIVEIRCTEVASSSENLRTSACWKEKTKQKEKKNATLKLQLRTSSLHREGTDFPESV